MRIIAWTLGFQIAVSALAAEKVLSPQQTAPTLISQKYTNGVALVAGPDDANIAKVTARILERSHYLRQNFNDEISSKLFDRYFEALDNLRLFFLQSDVEEFEPYRTQKRGVLQNPESDYRSTDPGPHLQADRCGWEDCCRSECDHFLRPQ